jgi:uncharacterized protein (TIGR03437 family)
MARANLVRFSCLVILSLAGGLPAQTVVFVPQLQVPTGAKPDCVVLADFTGDGVSDLVVAEGGAATLNVLRGLGNGLFVPLATVAVGQTPSAIAVGDFNRDGKLDLAVANFASNSVSVLLGNGNGTFRLFETLAATGPLAISVGDFNGDGKLDLAVAATTSNTISIFLGTGTGNFLPFGAAAAGERPVSIAAADFNGDGRLDLAVANLSSNTVSILLGNGNGTFLAPIDFAAGPLPASIALGDFNGDGRIDLAVANATGFSSGTVTVLLGLPGVAFQPPRTFTTGADPTFLLAADFNLDGKLDLAVANTGSNSISILSGLGDGAFLAPLYFATGSAPAWMAVGELNGNNRPGLVVANSASNSLSVLLNQTAAVLRPKVSATVNAAGMQSGAVAPGEMVTIFGSNLGPTTPRSLQVSESGAAATSLSGTQVFFDGVAAPLVYAASGQVSAVVPFGVADRSSTQMTIANGGETSANATLGLSPSAPGVFTVNASGSGPGAILNQDGTVNGEDNPAAAGSVVALFLTGAGATNPPSTDGTLGTNALATLTLPVSVTIGGQPAQVTYAGSAPGLLAGVAQINTEVPNGLVAGSVQVLVAVGGAKSQSGVTLNVR